MAERYKLPQQSKIVRNSAKCKLCQEEIESKHRHDFVTCGCGGISVDGGKDYLRRAAYNLGNIEDTSVFEGDEVANK